MIDSKAIAEIVAIYQRYGWILRRVLLTAESNKRLETDITQLFDAVQVTDADIDAAWFSRPPQDGGVAWEIRHLSESPYALLENMDEDSSEFENSLHSVESRLREAIAKSKSA